MLLVDLDGDDGSVGQDSDTGLVTENIGGFLESLQDGLLNLGQLLLIISRVNNELFFLLLQFRVLFLDNNSEQLVSQTLESDHEVE